MTLAGDDAALCRDCMARADDAEQPFQGRVGSLSFHAFTSPGGSGFRRFLYPQIFEPNVLATFATAVASIALSAPPLFLRRRFR